MASADRVPKRFLGVPLWDAYKSSLYPETLRSTSAVGGLSSSKGMLILKTSGKVHDYMYRRDRTPDSYSADLCDVDGVA